MYLLRSIIAIPPLCSSVDGILLRVSCISVADGAEIGQKAEDLLEGEPLVCRGRGMVLRLVWASRLGEALAKTEDLSKPEWCFVRWLQFGQNLEELAHGVCPSHADIHMLKLALTPQQHIKYPIFTTDGVKSSI